MSTLVDYQKRSRATTPNAQQAMSFAIETKTEHYGWSDDPSLLGLGYTEADNFWPTEVEALEAIGALVAEGFNRHNLRVVDHWACRIVPLDP